MDKIKDILLEGEKVIWLGRPDPNLSRPLAPYWKRKLRHLFWLALFAGLAVLLGYIGSNENIRGILELIVGTVTVIIILGVVIGFFAFLDFKDDEIPHQADIYAVTDRRLIAFNSEKNYRRYVFPNSVSYISNNTQNHHRTLSLAYGHGESENLLLHGLHDAEEVEKMIVERFSIREQKLDPAARAESQ